MIVTPLRHTRWSTTTTSKQRQAQQLRQLSYHSKRCNYYLHVGPSGDFWTGNEMYAAKHLQPDYVKSIALPEGWTEESPKTEALLASLDENSHWLHRIYDSGVIDPHLLQQADEQSLEAEATSRKDNP